jgi:hypothetical protein
MEMLQTTEMPAPCTDQTAGAQCAPYPSDTELAIPEQEPASEVFEQEPIRQIALARTILRVVEIALALTAILSGIAAFIIFRRRGV